MKKQFAMNSRLSGPFQMKTGKIRAVVKNVQILFASLATIIVFGSSAFGSFIHDGYEYSLTANTYSPTADWTQAVIMELGPAAHVVDWNIIKSEFGSSVNSLRSFLDGIGVTDVNFAPGVTWNGSQTWAGSTRSYGINRAEGNVPFGYLIHEQIQSNWLLLGSWPADRYLVASVPLPVSTTPVPEPGTVLLLCTGILGLVCTRLIRKSG